VHNGSLNLVFEYCATDLEKVINDKKMILDAARIKACMLGTLTLTLTCSGPNPVPNPNPNMP